MSIADKLTQIAENEQKVYEAGKRAEWDNFWDRFQANRENMKHAMNGVFNGNYWGFDNFYPKYDIKPTGDTGQFLFYAWEREDSEGSLKQRLDECGVVLDTSKATSLSQAFGYSKITEIPTIDCTGLVGDSGYVFANCYQKVKNIEKLIVKEDTTFNSWFANTSLTEIRFEGTIGRSLNVSFGTYGVVLTVESMKSIISCLKNYLGTDSEFDYKLSFADVSWTALEADSTAPNGGTWREYVHSLGWNT